jgi:hypothetical protein
VVRKIKIAFDLFFNKNCPRPGTSRDDSETALGFADGFRVLFEVAIENG